MGSRPLTSLRFVNGPSDRFPFSHGSTVYAIDDSRLVCVWFAGNLEGHSDTAILLSRLDLSGGFSRWAGPSWSEPAAIAEEDGRAVGNPVLFMESPTDWWLFYTTFPPRKGSHTEVRYRKSVDGGHTWSTSYQLTSDLGYWSRHPILVIPQGDWLLPLCNTYQRPPLSMVWRSSDRGATWTEAVITGSEDRIQPSLVLLEDGHVQAYMRNSAVGRIYRSQSLDGGQMWEVPTPTVLPNNNSSVQALLLRSGRLLMAFNDQARRSRRSPLTIALSDDGGETWPWRTDVVPYLDLEASVAQFSYPAVAETNEGTIHVTFTNMVERIAHATLDEGALVAQEPRLVDQVTDASGGSGYTVRALRRGEPIYFNDGRSLVEKMPVHLVGKLALCTVNSADARTSSSDAFLRLRLARRAVVTVAYDARAKRLPRWLEGFSALDERIVAAGGKYKLYQEVIEPGDHVFGGNLEEPAVGATRMYFLFFVPTGD